MEEINRHIDNNKARCPLTVNRFAKKSSRIYRREPIRGLRTPGKLSNCHSPELVTRLVFNRARSNRGLCWSPVGKQEKEMSNNISKDYIYADGGVV